MERAIVRTVPPEAATANFVPAAAVIRRWQALFGFTGRTGCVGGLVSLLLKLRAQPGKRRGYCQARGWERSAEFPVFSFESATGRLDRFTGASSLVIVLMC